MKLKFFKKIPLDLFWKSKLLNPLSANPTKWSNTLKQFVGNLPTNCLSVFDHFVRLALKGLNRMSFLWFLIDFTLQVYKFQDVLKNWWVNQKRDDIAVFLKMIGTLLIPFHAVLMRKIWFVDQVFVRIRPQNSISRFWFHNSLLKVSPTKNENFWNVVFAAQFKKFFFHFWEKSSSPI